MTNIPIQHNKTDEFLSLFNANKSIMGKKVLDVGCGDGYAALQFKLRGAAVVHAVDVESDPILLVDQDIQFSRAYRGGEYDLIWHHHVLEHVEDCFSFLRDLRSRLSENGWMWMAVPNMASHAVYSPGHIHNFQASQLVEVLRRCGFGVNDIRVWVKEGQLRVRVPKNGSTEYPEPMAASLKETGRCPAEVMNKWRWTEA